MKQTFPKYKKPQIRKKKIKVIFFSSFDIQPNNESEFFNLLALNGSRTGW